MITDYRVHMLYPKEAIVTGDYVLKLANDHKESELQLEIERAKRGGLGGDELSNYTYRPIYDLLTAMEYLDDEGAATFSGKPFPAK